VALAKEGRNPHLIAEMDHSYFVVGDHQFHQGYDTFQPWELNFSCYGNAEPHVHWHIVPRYEAIRTLTRTATGTSIPRMRCAFRSSSTT